MDKRFYIFFDSSNTNVLASMEVSEDFDKKIQELQSQSRFSLEVCTKKERDESYARTYHLTTEYGWMRSVILQIEQAHNLLQPRMAEIDDFLNNLGGWIRCPSRYRNGHFYEIDNAWQLRVLIEEQLHAEPTNWIKTLAAGEEPQMLLHLKAVAAELEKRGYTTYLEESEFAQEIDKGSYLLRYDKLRTEEDEEEREGLVVMGDLGVTWEPACAHTTPCYGKIGGSDAEADAVELIRIYEHRQPEE